jgi:ABC-type Mn2+/Zn2+ transport system ATPase subunit
MTKEGAMAQPVIAFADAVLGYGRKVVLSGITLSIDAGEYVGMVGPNGAGKTTIVRTILGTLPPLGGSVRVIGPDGGRPRFGYVPQRDRIDSVMPYTVEQVVMMGRYRDLGLLARAGAADRAAVDASLDHVDILPLRKHAFNDLSGGQKQRVLIARALASRPDILILDEPTNGMDLSSRIAMLELIARLHADDRLTVLMVSHLLDDVANYVKRIAIVEQDFFQVGPVDEVLTGANLSSLYGMHVRVARIEGGTVIHARGTHGHR